MREMMRFFNRNQKIRCAAAILLSAVSAFLTAAWPVVLGDIYDGISAGRIDSVTAGLHAFAVFGLLLLTAECISIFRRVWVDLLVVSSERSLRDLSIRKILRQPVSCYDRDNSGTFTAKINQGVAGASQLIRVFCNNIVPSVLVGIFLMGQAVVQAPVLIAGLMLSYGIIEILISVLQIRSQNGIREGLVRSKNELDGDICQAICNIELIRVMNAEEYEGKKMEPRTEKICRTESRHHMCMGGFDSAKQIVKVIYMVGLLAVCVFMASRGMIATGMVITVMLLFQQMITPLESIHAFLDETASAAVKIKALTELRSQQDDEVFEIENTGKQIRKASLTFKDVSVFSPDRSKKICSGVSLTFRPGHVSALQGKTGCGKSSFFKGLMRYYPTDGTIRLGEVDLAEISPSQLAEHVVYLTQDSIFFAGTLRENLLYGLDRPPEDEELAHALRQACIFGELTEKTKRGTASLPESDTASAVSAVLDLPVAEEGSNFSGGQKQRVALARAFLRRPDWFILDESTANLDKKTAASVLDNLERYAASLSAGIIHISHDPAVMARCEEILMLSGFSGGEHPADIAETGNPACEDRAVNPDGATVTEIPAAGTESETPDDAAGAERQVTAMPARKCCAPEKPDREKLFTVSVSGSGPAERPFSNGVSRRAL